MALQLPFITYITLTNQNNSTMKQTASEGKQERNMYQLKPLNSYLQKKETH